MSINLNSISMSNVRTINRPGKRDAKPQGRSTACGLAIRHMREAGLNTGVFHFAKVILAFTAV